MSKSPEILNTMKKLFCKNCKEMTERYDRRNRDNGNGVGQCIACAKRISKHRRQERRNLGLSSFKLLYYNLLKIKIFNAYKNRCACCGETNLFFLELDHVNNDSYITRKRSNNSWLNLKEAIKNPQQFQILCANCNAGKARNNGTCPHKTVNSVPNWFIADLME